MSASQDPASDGLFAFMCGKCFQVFPSMDAIENHNCSALRDEGGAVNTAEFAEEEYVAAEVVEVNPHPCDSIDSLEVEKINYVVDQINRGNQQIQNESEEYYVDLFDDSGSNVHSKKRTNNNGYLMNKLVRDPYFKLDRNTYTFKDTLGDWDEKSTMLLIILVGRFPKVFFLLQLYVERRLAHWENIHSCMVNAGYNFTVLQLRMRWREVLAKYRWTLNHNYLNEQKKTFEYMKEMDELFGIWSEEQVLTLLNLIECSKDNPSSKHKRLGYMGWERVTHILEEHNIKFTVLQVEARWRMLVTTYKSVMDHNMMPTVQPIEAAFSEQLSAMIAYEPRRRKDYEKYKGKKVKLEKFPESGMKVLIHLYKENINQFFNKDIKNETIWTDIRMQLEQNGYIFTLAKMKEIFFATLKLYERVLHHNSIPGAIRREGPHFDELNDIYSVYGHWPHINRRRKTLHEKTQKKFKVKLRESMQNWHTDESFNLLKLYPDMLESFASQTTQSHHSNDLWVQVAHTYKQLGFAKRDIPEIATHIGLLRQGYSQGNPFPYVKEMQRVMEVEEALCYSPDVSKYTGEVEIVYWSHDAINLMLSLYLKIQPLLPYSSLSNEVYKRITNEMRKAGYKYVFEDVRLEFRSLLNQCTQRRVKPRQEIFDDDWPNSKNEETDNDPSANDASWGFGKIIKGAIPYKELMLQVIEMRNNLSVGFTNGIKPIPRDILEIILRVAHRKATELFSVNHPITHEKQKDSMKLLVLRIRSVIKKETKRKPPIARKICVQLLSSLSNYAEGLVYSSDLEGLLNAFEGINYEFILTEIMRETENGTFKLDRTLLDMERSFDFEGHKSSAFEENDAFDCILSVADNKGDVQDEYIRCLQSEDDIKPKSDEKASDMLIHSIDEFNQSLNTPSTSSIGIYLKDKLKDKRKLDECSQLSTPQKRRIVLENRFGQIVDYGLENLNKASTSKRTNMNKMTIVDKTLGRKTTILPQEESQMAYIKIEDFEQACNTYTELSSKGNDMGSGMEISCNPYVAQLNSSAVEAKEEITDESSTLIVAE